MGVMAKSIEIKNRPLIIGDVVRLKSHGPKMTISGFTKDKVTPICYWFAADGVTLHKEYFPQQSLILMVKE